MSRSNSSFLTPQTGKNPARERSKWRFYTVKIGTNADNVYLSWNQANRWDTNTQYFFLGCVCKGFNLYDQTSLSLNLDHFLIIHPLITVMKIQKLIYLTGCTQKIAALLTLCISGNILSSFIDNSKYDNKGIEMLQQLITMKHPTSKPSSSTVYNTSALQKSGTSEMFHNFAKKLYTMHETCTTSSIPYHCDEGYLIWCFIQGLNHNYNYVRELLDNGVLPWL